MAVIIVFAPSRWMDGCCCRFGQCRLSVAAVPLSQLLPLCCFFLVVVVVVAALRHTFLTPPVAVAAGWLIVTV